MDESCLRFCLTETERRRFEKEGYLVVEEAMPADWLKRLDEICEQMLDQRRQDRLGPHQWFSQPDVIARDPVFQELVDWERTFPKVWGVLGWNIFLYHSHLDVTPPSHPDPPPGSSSVAWHQDSLRVNDEIESRPRPCLSLKIGYYLTDVSAPGGGNTLIVPGSHLHDELDVRDDGVSNPPGAIPLCVDKGTAVLIDRRLWHSRSRNLSRITRKVLWYGYAYRWLQPKDDLSVQHLYP